MTRGKSIIQQQLDIRQQLGKAVAVVGISAGLAALNSFAIDNDSFAISAVSVENAAPLASGKFTWNRAIFVFFKRFIWKLSRKCLYLQAIE